jgi:hypothetical protein
MIGWLLFVSTVLLLGAAAAGAAGPQQLRLDPGKEQIKLTAGGQAAAREVVLRRSDLGSTAWRGGAVTPDLSGGPRCATYQPKQSDLVLTGAARSRYARSLVVFDNEVQVLKTRRMVRLDWQRTVLDPRVLPCARQTLLQQLGGGVKLVSFRIVPFPRLSPYARKYRAIVSSPTGGSRARVVADIVLVGRSRTEITLSAAAPAAAAGPLALSEVRIARTLLARVRT